MLHVITPSVKEPVTVAEVKEHCRITHSADDGLLSAQITAAREAVEMQTGLALAAAEYVWTPEECGYPGWRPSLPLSPATVTEVSYYDGETRVVALADDYRFDDVRGRLSLGGWYEPNVTFTVEPGTVPEALKSAIKLRVQAEYEADPDQAQKLRDAAYQIAFHWRRTLGV